MKYAVSALFAIAALLAVLLVAQIQAVQPSMGGIEIKANVAVIGLCIVLAAYIFAASVEKIWRIIKPE